MTAKILNYMDKEAILKYVRYQVRPEHTPGFVTKQCERQHDALAATSLLIRDHGQGFIITILEMACSRLSSNAAIDSSDWRCSRAAEESVPRCRGNKEDGAHPMSPDVRIPGMVKRVKGLQEGEKEDAEELEETADGGAEQTVRRAGNLDIPREAADPVEEQRLEETRRNCHVPGGAWLSNVRSFFKGRLIENPKSWDRGEEGRDVEEGAERGAAGRGQGSDGRDREKDSKGSNNRESSTTLFSP
ncbi:hypothetical protein NDU88_005186 [Pleurodeles waltl]|uniref:Uncharacterized protein n=1 Tax=Pleurodeles waltl TaxID=8319 RepID=A0AAV7MC63_PLEWA|nr:hypothetical protein NDU88_005186 [Pleurodeles waltl]